jgi:hypothetical protein
VLRHEVNRFRRDLLGGDGQVALVFTILVIDNDDHLTIAECGDRILDACKRPGGFTGALGDLHS